MHIHGSPETAARKCVRFCEETQPGFMNTWELIQPVIPRTFVEGMAATFGRPRECNFLITMRRYTVIRTCCSAPSARSSFFCRASAYPAKERGRNRLLGVGGSFCGASKS
ncbi:unnamed protein product, partial [Mesorhabditis spiculigera]